MNLKDLRCAHGSLTNKQCVSLCPNVHSDRERSRRSTKVTLILTGCDLGPQSWLVHTKLKAKRKREKGEGKFSTIFECDKLGVLYIANLLSAALALSR